MVREIGAALKCGVLGDMLRSIRVGHSVLCPYGKNRTATFRCWREYGHRLRMAVRRNRDEALVAHQELLSAPVDALREKAGEPDEEC